MSLGPPFVFLVIRHYVRCLGLPISSSPLVVHLHRRFGCRCPFPSCPCIVVVVLIVVGLHPLGPAVVVVVVVVVVCPFVIGVSSSPVVFVIVAPLLFSSLCPPRLRRASCSFPRAGARSSGMCVGVLSWRHLVVNNIDKT